METQSVMERTFYMLRQGYLKIDADGCLWRCAIYTHGKWKPVVPRRAENVGGKGYLRLTLQMSSGKTASAMAHRIVWEWLNGPIPAGQQINHKDLNKQNNSPANLEVVTPSGNIRHSYDNGRPKPWHNTVEWRGKPRITEPQKVEIRKLRERGLTLKEIGKQFNLGTTHVNRICAGRRNGGNDG
jgi:hypothetical protein